MLEFVQAPLAPAEKWDPYNTPPTEDFMEMSFASLWGKNDPPGQDK